MATSTTTITSSLPPLPTTVPSASLTEVQWWDKFLLCLGSQNIEQADLLLKEKSNTHTFFSRFFDSKVRQLLQKTSATIFNEDNAVPNDSLYNVISITEFLAQRGLESSFCRLCRAAVYLHLKEEAKLKAVLPELSQGRGPDVPSDLFELKERLMRLEDRKLVAAYFSPLHKAIQENLQNSRPKFPINNLNDKI